MKALEPDRLVGLTGRRIASAQARELDHLGIRYSRRRDGSLIVLEENVRRVLTATVATATVTTCPNFGAINRRRK